MSGPLCLIPVDGIGEVRPGADLADLIAEHAELADGDVVVVTSKIVSKSEGRLIRVPTDPEGRDRARRAAIDQEATELVAQFKRTKIVRTRHGLVMAAAGVDGSNVRPDEIALLPIDPDASARRLRDGLAHRTGRMVAVIITDTMGRAWREGLVDQAIGAAGIAPLRDHRGERDPFGHQMEVSVAADADAIAAAAELVKGKFGGVPVAILRGFDYQANDDGAAALIRPLASDLFYLGTDEARRRGRREAVTLRHSVRRFAPTPVPGEIVKQAIAAGLAAPRPHRSRPVSFHVVAAERESLLREMEAVWRADLAADGLSAQQIDQRIARGKVLHQAPVVVLPLLDLSAATQYPDARRQFAEQAMFIAAGGAAVENLLVRLAADGVGSLWVSSTFFCPQKVRAALGLTHTVLALGAIAIGYPEQVTPAG